MSKVNIYWSRIVLCLKESGENSEGLCPGCDWAGMRAFRPAMNQEAYASRPCTQGATHKRKAGTQEACSRLSTQLRARVSEQTRRPEPW